MADKKETAFDLFRRLAPFIRPYRKRLIIGILAGMIAGGSLFGILAKLQSSLSALQIQDGKAAEVVKVENVTEADKSKEEQFEYYLQKLPDSAENLIRENIKLYDDNGELSGGLIVMAVFFLIILFFVKGAATYINRFCLRWVGARVVADLRSGLFDKILKQSLSFHNEKETGDLMARCLNDTTAINKVVASTIAALSRAPFEIVSVLGFLVYFAVTNGLFELLFVLLVCIPMAMVPIVILGKRLKRYATRVFKKVAVILTRMEETFNCVRAVKSYDMEDYESKRFSEQNDRHFGDMMKALKYELMMSPFMEFAGVVAASFFMVFCYMRGFNIDVIMTLGTALYMAYAPFKQLTKIHADIQVGTAAFDRIREYLELNREIPESPNAKEISKMKNEIAIDDISFSYSGQQTLKNISLSIKQGQFVAFVGEAGSGKSTIVNMMARFYDIHEGSIKLDGQDVRDITSSSLHKLIGFVDQTTILFNNTIRYNIAYGVEDATEEQIIEAAKKADVYGFAMEKEEGLDFLVGEKGMRLSGGQRQRVAIARAILKDPDILILDEATSALDNITEKTVQKALDELMNNRTVISIAHRLSTIKNADVIYVMEQGEICEQGSHEELLAKKGLYARMWNIQFTEKS